MQNVTHGAVVKNLPANAEDTEDVSSILGLGRPLEKEMATYSSTLAWKIPWIEEPDRSRFCYCNTMLHEHLRMWQICLRDQKRKAELIVWLKL